MSIEYAAPLYIKVKNDLLIKIRKKFWSVDQQIPSEQELMNQYDVGRETIRKAVDLLVREGYLYKKRGIGTFVKRNSPTLTLEPLISLSNLFTTWGYNDKNSIMEKEILTVDQLLKNKTKMNIGDKIIYIKRKRTIDEDPLVLESAYFVYSKGADEYNFEKSITKYLLEYKQLHLYKIDQTFIKRKPTGDECEILLIEKDVDIIELERWIYMEEYEGVYFYVKILILSDIYDYSL